MSDVIGKKTLSGHVIEPMVGEEDESYRKYWKGYTSGCIRLQPGGTLLTTPFAKFHDRIMKFPFTAGDVCVVTYPKCGTTWLQEIIWTMRNNADLNNPMAQAPVNARVPFLELDALVASDALPVPGPDHPLMQTFKKMCPNGNPAEGVFLQLAEVAPQPRTVKSHLPFSLLPRDMLDKVKVVYAYRNPKDLVVSFLHHCKIFRNHDFTGSFEEFIDEFVNGNLLYGHYDRHLIEAFSRKGHDNLYLVRYEDFKADPMKEIKKLNKFLGTDLTKDQLKKVVHYTSFEEMKKRDNVVGNNNEESGLFNMDVIRKDGGFFRKGQAGNYKKTLPTNLAKKVDAWTEEKLGDTGIAFRYSA